MVFFPSGTRCTSRCFDATCPPGAGPKPKVRWVGEADEGSDLMTLKRLEGLAFRLCSLPFRIARRRFYVYFFIHVFTRKTNFSNEHSFPRTDPRPFDEPLSMAAQLHEGN